MYDKMLQENLEIKALMKEFKGNGKNSSKLEEKIAEVYRELEEARNQNFDLNEKIWKMEGEFGVVQIESSNTASELEKLKKLIKELREENMGLKVDLESWKEKFQNERQRNIYLEQENKILEENNSKMEISLEDFKIRIEKCDAIILETSKENSSLSTAKRMLEDKITGMNREIERMNNMVSVSQSQMGQINAENRSNFLQSENGFGINTTFGKDGNRTASGLIQGLNSQLAELRNEKEEIKVELQREKRETEDQVSILGK